MMKSEFYLKVDKANEEQKDYFAIVVCNANTKKPELILNHIDELTYKANYINIAYDDEMKLKVNKDIKIEEFITGNSLTEIEEVYKKFL